MNISKITKQALKDNRKELFRKKNVVAVGVGEERVSGTKTGRESVVCFVKKKLPKEQLQNEDLIPSSLSVDSQTVPTDVIEVGEIKALGIEEHQDKHRPILPGISVGHYAITAGTLGLIVEKNNEVYILSNNHVLADSNYGKLGDPILQPGPYDGGSLSSDVVGELSEYVPIKFGEFDSNLVDAALAKIYVGQPKDPAEEEPTEEPEESKSFLEKILDFFKSIVNSLLRLVGLGKEEATVARIETEKQALIVEYSTDVLNLGKVSGYVRSTVAIGEILQKSGRTTGYTEGEVLATDALVSVDYGPAGVANFDNQIITSYMSDGGDSGSAVFNKDKHAVGLLYAGSDTITILNYMDDVFKALNIDRIKIVLATPSVGIG